MFKGSTVDLYTWDFLSPLHLWLTSLQFRERNFGTKVSNSSPWIRTLERYQYHCTPFAKGAEEVRLPWDNIQKTSNVKEKWPQAKNRLEEETGTVGRQQKEARFHQQPGKWKVKWKRDAVFLPYWAGKFECNDNNIRCKWAHKLIAGVHNGTALMGSFPALY